MASFASGLFEMMRLDAPRIPRTANQMPLIKPMWVPPLARGSEAQHACYAAARPRKSFAHLRRCQDDDVRQLLQEIAVPQLLRDVLVCDEGDALREKPVELHLEAVVEEGVDLPLPLLVLEPGVRLYLVRTRGGVLFFFFLLFP